MATRKNSAGGWFWLLLGGAAYAAYQMGRTNERERLGLPADGAVGAIFGRLRGVVSQGHREPPLRKLAAMLRMRVGHDPLERLSAIDGLIRLKVRWHPDPGGRHDYFAPAVETLKSLVGDCDDQAVAVATLLEADGFETAFLLVPNHVVTCVRVEERLLSKLEARHTFKPVVVSDGNGGKWLPLDVVSEQLGPGQVMDVVKRAMKANKAVLEPRPLLRKSPYS